MKPPILSLSLSPSVSLPPPSHSTEWQRWHSIVQKTLSWKRAAVAACAQPFPQILPPLSGPSEPVGVRGQKLTAQRQRNTLLFSDTTSVISAVNA